MLWQVFSPPMLASMFLFGVLMIMVMFFFIFNFKEYSLVLEWEFVSDGCVFLGVPILFDKMSLLFGSVVVIISFSVMLFSMSYMSGDESLKYFIYMVMSFIFSMNLLIFLPHMIMLLLGWDGLGLTSYLLVIYYLSDKSLGAGMITAMTNRIGDAALILGISWSFISGHWFFVFSSFSGTSFIMFMVVLAGLTKSAQIPFSAWLPAAMAAPTPVSALVHSSTLVTAGVYLMIRFYGSLSVFVYFNVLMLFLGVMTCLMASLSAVFEVDLKKIIALSTLSQLGVMMISIGLNQPGFAFFHLITHALFKALLFICAGTLIHNMQDNQDIRLMGNMAGSMPLTVVVLNVANFSLCGFPFLAGFYSKDSIVESFFMEGVSLFISGFLMLSVCLTSVYTIRLSFILLWFPVKGAPFFTLGDESKVTWLSYFILVGGAVMMGASLFWLLIPGVEPMIMPCALKVSVLFFLFLFAVLSLGFLVNYGDFSGGYYMSSMWFLSYLSGTISSNKALCIQYRVQYNELSWMEILSGKGVGQVALGFISWLQGLSNISFSQMLTLTSLLGFCYLAVGM